MTHNDVEQRLLWNEYRKKFNRRAIDVIAGVSCLCMLESASHPAFMFLGYSNSMASPMFGVWVVLFLLCYVFLLLFRIFVLRNHDAGKMVKLSIVAICCVLLSFDVPFRLRLLCSSHALDSYACSLIDEGRSQLVSERGSERGYVPEFEGQFVGMYYIYETIIDYDSSNIYIVTGGSPFGHWGVCSSFDFVRNKCVKSFEWRAFEVEK